MKKIAFVIATLNKGGAERNVSNIVTHLPDDYEADIILNDTSDIAYPYKGNIISLGMKPQINKVNIWYQFKVLIKRIRVLKRLKKTNNYEAVFSFADSASVANILSGNKYCKTIVSVRNNLTKAESSWAYRYFVNPLARCLYNKADKIVAVSKGIEWDLVNNLNIKKKLVTTIYNGIDAQIVDDKMREEVSWEEQKIRDTKYTLITVGRLVNQKGQWHLIRALSILSEKNVDFKLLVLGQGELKNYLEGLVNDLGLRDRVYFLGFCENPFKYFKLADVCVVPSMYEGFGNALIEAMCCGVPCISTDHDSGARELLAPDTELTYKNITGIEYAKYGVVVPVCDGKYYQSFEVLTDEEKILGKAICELLSNEDILEEYRAKLKERIVQFDIHEVVKQWIHLLEE